jgi:hypothetical protein
VERGAPGWQALPACSWEFVELVTVNPRKVRSLEDYLSILHDWTEQHADGNVSLAGLEIKGPLPDGATKTIRGRIYLFKGTKEVCFQQYTMNKSHAAETHHGCIKQIIITQRFCTQPCYEFR